MFILNERLPPYDYIVPAHSTSLTCADSELGHSQVSHLHYAVLSNSFKLLVRVSCYFGFSGMTVYYRLIYKVKMKVCIDNFCL